jgi:uncharacterized protein (DUF433 family)
MTLTPRTLPSHLVFDENGRAYLEGTGVKVVEIAEDVACGMSANEIHEQYDLPLATVHAALSYYYDHQAQFDAEVEERRRYAEQARLEAGESPFVKRMRAEGKLP